MLGERECNILGWYDYRRMGNIKKIYSNDFDFNLVKQTLFERQPVQEDDHKFCKAKRSAWLYLQKLKAFLTNNTFEDNVKINMIGRWPPSFKAVFRSAWIYILMLENNDLYMKLIKETLFWEKTSTFLVVRRSHLFFTKY